MRGARMMRAGRTRHIFENLFCLLAALLFTTAHTRSDVYLDPRLSPLLSGAMLTSNSAKQSAQALDHLDQPELQPQQPVTCLDSLHIATAYVYRERNDTVIHAALTSCGSLVEADTTCAMVSGAKVLWGKLTSFYLRTTCTFEASLQTPLPSKIYLVKIHATTSVSSTTNRRGPIAPHTLVGLSSSLACRVPVQAISRPEAPSMFLIGLTQIKTAAKHVKDWIDFSLYLGGLDHLVIYDDGSTDNIREVLEPYHRAGLVTYINWTIYARHQGTRYSRQFLAMEDFAIRFAPFAEIIQQYDDDCFFYGVPSNVTAVETASVRERLRYLIDKHPQAGQILVLGKWFGACTTSSDSSQNFVLEHGRPGVPVYAQHEWRYEPMGWYVDWIKSSSSNRPRNISTALSYVRSSHLMYGRNFTHFWHATGEELEAPPECLVYNHYKTLPWKEHQDKNKHTWVASIASSRKEHLLMNQILCKKEDHTLVNAYSAVSQWITKSADEMASFIKARGWPVLQRSIPQCDVDEPNSPFPQRTVATSYKSSALSSSAVTVDRRAPTKTKYDFPQSYSPLMRAIGFPNGGERVFTPRTCFHSFHIATAYSLRNASTGAVEVFIAGAGNFSSKDLVVAYENDLHQGLIVGECSTIHQRTTCTFGDDSAVNSLPTEITIMKRAQARSAKTKATPAMPTHGVCLVNVQPIQRPTQPSMFLIGVTEIRNATQFISSWLTYHLRLGYDHIVIYDDNSTDHILDVLYPFYHAGLVTYIDWTVYSRFPGLQADRQLVAIEDFAIRFAANAKLINQFDDDCYFYPVLATPNVNDQGSIRNHLQFLIENNTNAGQFLVLGKWFGACNASSEGFPPEDHSYVLQEGQPNIPPYARMQWRHFIKWRVPWIKSELAPVQFTALSFALSDKILHNPHTTQVWATSGDKIFVPPKCIVYNHYKTLPWSEHRQKNERTWIGSIASKAEHDRMNEILCKVQDTNLTQLAPAVEEWGQQSFTTIASIVKSLPWPTAISTDTFRCVSRQEERRLAHLRTVGKSKPHDGKAPPDTSQQRGRRRSRLGNLRSTTSTTIDNANALRLAGLDRSAQTLLANGFAADIASDAHPLARGAATTSFKPATCFKALHVFTAYAFRSANGTVQIALTAVGSLSAKLEYVCCFIDRQTKAVLCAPLSFRPHRADCVFDESTRRAELPMTVVVMERNYSTTFVAQRAAGKRSRDESRMTCRVNLHPIVHPVFPSVFLAGVVHTSGSWREIVDSVLYHLRIGFDKMFIYCTDAQFMSILDQERAPTDQSLPPTVTDALASSKSLLAALEAANIVVHVNVSSLFLANTAFSAFSQQLAMEDFAIRYAREAEVVSFLCHGCFVYAAPDPQSASLRDNLLAAMQRHPEAGQVVVAGKWFGACTTSVLTGSPEVMQKTSSGYPLYAEAEWRHSNITWLMKKVSAGKFSIASSSTKLSFAKSQHIKYGLGHMRFWEVHGTDAGANFGCLTYNHYKLRPWQQHQAAKDTADLASMTVEEYTALNLALCNVKDSNLTHAADWMQDWISQPPSQIVTELKARRRPKASGVTGC